MGLGLGLGLGLGSILQVLEEGEREAVEAEVAQQVGAPHARGEGAHEQRAASAARDGGRSVISAGDGRRSVISAGDGGRSVISARDGGRSAIWAGVVGVVDGGVARCEEAAEQRVVAGRHVRLGVLDPGGHNEAEGAARLGWG